MRSLQVYVEVAAVLEIPLEDAAVDEINIETVYEGSRICPKCGHMMTPLEVMYAGGELCPNCRNARYEKHAKGFMNS
jgi:NADH pyrophosphatase NudC (nudix superfamily)